MCFSTCICWERRGGEAGKRVKKGRGTSAQQAGQDKSHWQGEEAREPACHFIGLSSNVELLCAASLKFLKLFLLPKHGFVSVRVCVEG